MFRSATWLSGILLNAFRQKDLPPCRVSIHPTELLVPLATPGPETLARNLSGGNQQKAILAREITAGKTLTEGDEVPLIVAVHPTRGLDVGAIENVREQLLEQRRQGAAILLVSGELEELIALSDRIAVIHSGEIMGIVDAAEANIDELGLMMAGERRT